MTYRAVNGEIRQTKKWSLDFHDHNGRRRRFAVLESKEETDRIGRRIQRLVDCRVTGEPAEPKLIASLRSLPDHIVIRLQNFGVLDPEAASGVRSLDELVDELERQLRSVGRSDLHIGVLFTRIRKVIDACGFDQPADLDAQDVEEYFAARQADGRFGAQTRRHYIRALQQLTGHLIRSGSLQSCPFVALAKPRVEPDRRLERRALSLEELQYFLKATTHGPTRQGRYKSGRIAWRMNGAERALLYRIACETGLRSTELRALTPASFELEASPPTVTVSASTSKRRRKDSLPLREETAECIQRFTLGESRDLPLFDMPRREDVARLIFRPDLEHARATWIAEAETEVERDQRKGSSFLVAVDDQGQRVDFHSLRGTFVTLLAQAGVGFATVQRLARHSSPMLLNRYATSFGEDEVRAIERLPLSR